MSIDKHSRSLTYPCDSPVKSASSCNVYFLISLYFLIFTRTINDKFSFEYRLVKVSLSFLYRLFHIILKKYVVWLKFLCYNFFERSLVLKLHISRSVLRRIAISFLALFFGTVSYFLFDIGIINNSNIFFRLLRNYLPDFLWAFSFFFLTIIFSFNISEKKYLFISGIYVASIGIIFEILQYFNIAKGTFDFFDIVIYLIAILIACFIETKLRRRESEKN